MPDDTNRPPRALPKFPRNELEDEERDARRRQRAMEELDERNRSRQ